MKKLLKPILIILIAALVIGSLGFGAYKFFKSRGSTVPGTTSEEAKKESAEKAKKDRERKQAVLLDTIKELFNLESPGTTYSLAIYDLNNEEYFGVNDKTPQHAASVSKILTATYVLSQVEKGKATLAEPLGAYNVGFQLEKTVNQSDPETWALLDDRFKPADQNKFATASGLQNTNVSIGKNLMSTEDVATLLRKLYKHEILGEVYVNKLFTYMQNTESENFFSPVFKLNSLVFYHKTGKLEGEAHDAAIVEHKANPFILVVFTVNNSNLDPNTRSGIMQKVAQTVLDYFDSI